ncbi:MAG: response regulator [Candidatus Omnitrophica bacterium]|nr:response regulator [Candidatus Omnitrophota bacterium]
MAQILIIEDDVKFSDVLKEMLERQGYGVISAYDGEKGIKLYKDNPVPLVITDIIMPNKEGVETIFEFLRYFPKAKIIAISGGGKIKAGDHLKTVSALPNVKYTFEKPFVMDEFIKAVKEILGKEI